jgi:hypothetical protein
MILKQLQRTNPSLVLGRCNVCNNRRMQKMRDSRRGERVNSGRIQNELQSARI